MRGVEALVAHHVEEVDASAPQSAARSTSAGNSCTLYRIITTSKRTQGMLSRLSRSWHLADCSATEEQEEHRERVRLAVLGRDNEKAQDEARIREGWEKKEREKQKGQRARLA